MSKSGQLFFFLLFLNVRTILGKVIIETLVVLVFSKHELLLTLSLLFWLVLFLALIHPQAACICGAAPDPWRGSRHSPGSLGVLSQTCSL